MPLGATLPWYFIVPAPSVRVNVSAVPVAGVAVNVTDAGGVALLPALAVIVADTENGAVFWSLVAGSSIASPVNPDVQPLATQSW